jgi:hypothetical protein
MLILILSSVLPCTHHTINFIIKRCKINNDILREWVKERQMLRRHSCRENIDSRYCQESLGGIRKTLE